VCSCINFLIILTTFDGFEVWLSQALRCVMIESIFPYLFAILMLLAMVGFFFTYKMCRHLEVNHPKLYDQLGRPSLFMNNTPKSNFSFWSYVLGRKFNIIDDRKLNSLGNLLAILFKFYIVYFIFLIFLFILAHAIAP